MKIFKVFLLIVTLFCFLGCPNGVGENPGITDLGGGKVLYNNLVLNPIYNSSSTLSAYEIIDTGSELSGNFEIPSQFNGIDIVEISPQVFAGFEDLISIFIPETITTISSAIFDGCSDLIICTSHTSSPVGWNKSGWNYNRTGRFHLPVNWGCDGSCSKPHTPPQLAYTLLDNGTYSVKASSTSIKGLVEIPSTYKGKDVSEISSDGFRFCPRISGFSVTPDNTYFSVENGILYNKDKTNLIKYPPKKTETSFTIPDTVTQIGDISNCDSLTEIIVPESVRFGISSQPFSYCKKLSRITVAGTNTSYSSEDGILYDKDKSIIIKYPSAKTDSSFTMPDSVQEIYTSCFEEVNHLTSITLNDGLETIWHQAFLKTGLTSIFIPSTVQTMYSDIFAGCNNLGKICVAVSEKPTDWADDWNDNWGSTIDVHWGCTGLPCRQ